MVELNEKEKAILQEGKELLEKNDIEGFYDLDSLVWDDEARYHISQYLLDHGINLIKYCKEEVPSGMYTNTDVAEVVIPKGVKIIYGGAFENCKALKKVTLPEGLETIIEDAFKGCSSLEEITLPKSIKFMGYHLFDGCPKVTIYYYGDFNNLPWSDSGKYKRHCKRIG